MNTTENGQPLGLGLSEMLGAWPDNGPAEKPQDTRAGCAECRFKGPREGYDSYTCRRHAPIAVHNPNKYCGVHPEAFEPRWPFMRGSDRCGEFERA